MNIGIDLGGSHIGVGIVDSNAHIISKVEEDINKEDIRDIENILQIKIVKFINKILRDNDIDISKIDKIGIACPGEPINGCMQNIVNLGIVNFPIVEKLKNELNYKNISIRNDAKCAAIAEKKYGSLKNVQDGVFLCIGTGIGGAAFLEGKLLVPKKNSGFEFGHMIIEKNGKQCKCGNRGCFEAYGSMKNFKIDIAHILKQEETNSRKLLKLVKENIEYEKVDIVIEEYLNNLVVGLANIANILEPEIISIGGGFVYYRDILWNRLSNKFESTNLLFNKANRTKLQIANFGNDAGIIGASIDRI